MIDDSALLRAYAGNRSEPAFAEFVGRRIGFVYVAALRQVAGDAQMAEDVTQAVFVLAAKKAAALARHQRLAGWLHTTTRNTANHAWRDARRRDIREREAARMSELQRDDAMNAAGEADEADARAIGAAGIGEAEQLRPMLDETLGTLRELEREAVLLRFFEGRGFGEIGARLRMSEDAARMRVSRALEKMRGSLARKGVTSSAAALGALMTAEAAQAAPAGLAASVSAGAITSAGAVAAGAGVAGAILAFMSSAKITTAAIAVLLAAAGGVYYGARNERESVVSLAQAHQENKNIAEQLRVMEKREAVANGSAPAPKLTASELGQMLMVEHPEIRERLLASYYNHLGVGVSFRIAKALNLSPEQSEKLAEIIGQYASPTGADVPGYGPVFFDPREENITSDKIQNEIHDLLGDADYEKFQHLAKVYDNGSDMRAELSARLYLTDTPLTSQQAWGIDEINYDLSNNLPKGTEPEARWKIFQERAKLILSPEQMKAFADMGDGYIYQQTLSKMQGENTEATEAESK